MNTVMSDYRETQTTEQDNMPIFNPQVMEDDPPGLEKQIVKYQPPQHQLSKPLYNAKGGSGIGSLICGIISIITSAVPVLPLVLGAIGIFLSHDDKKNSQVYLEKRSGSAMAGLICSAIGIGLNLFYTCFVLLGILGILLF